MQGKVSVELVPSQDRAALMTLLTGTTVSDTIGYNGPVIIWADGTTHLNVRKKILVDGEGLSTLPASADATTSSHIRSIRANRSLHTQKIAFASNELLLAWPSKVPIEQRVTHLGVRRHQDFQPDFVNSFVLQIGLF